jgi:SHS2 domain-containing protein
VGIIMHYSYPERGPTADLLIEAKGKTLEEAFSNIVFGMFNLITPLEGISKKEEFKFEVEGNDLKSLLFNLMDEFLYINDVEFLVPKTINLEIDSVKFKIIAKCIGERFSAATHEVGIAVKAVTYHLMEIKKQPYGWFVQIVFDT